MAAPASPASGPAVHAPTTTGFPWALAALALVAVTLAGAVAWSRAPAVPPSAVFLDLGVYRTAGEALLSGRSIYDTPPDVYGFTYPPVAGLPAVLIALAPRTLAVMAWTVALTAALAFVVAVSFGPLLARVGARWGRWGPPLAVATLTAGASLLWPVWENYFLGQVNLLLAALVVADVVLPRTRWPRGVLVGVATAIKLTPAIFVVFWWFAGRRREALVAALTAAGAALLGFLVLPGDSWRYASDLVFQTSRVGSFTNPSNQSIRGMLERLVPEGSAVPVGALALVLALAVAVVGLRRAVAAHRAGDRVAAVALVGLVGVLVSPISWIAHLVWLIPALGALVGDGRRPRRTATAVATALFVCLLVPHFGETLLNRGGTLAPPGAVLVNAFGLLALALVLWLPWTPAGHRPDLAGGAPDRDPAETGGARHDHARP